MKKITSMLSITFVVIISGYIVGNAFSEDSTSDKVVIKDKPKTENKKEDYKYLTNDTDNIENVLKKKEKAVEEVEYVNKTIDVQVQVKNGFVEENSNMYYYEDDNMIIGEKEIEGNIYYFNEEGVMQKNTLIDNKYYDEEGKLFIGFIELDNNTYYFTNTGYLTGINEIENDIYYFNEEGILQKDIVIDNCYYDEQGKLYIGFKEIDNSTYYFTKDGLVKGIHEINNKKYYFDDEGHLIKNSFYDNYYLDEEGCIVTGERKIGDRTYIFDDDGKLLNGFQVIDNKTFFLDENMNKIKGLHLIDNIRYYFDFETGELIKKDVKSIIDISSWQGDINFEKLKDSNLIDGVIVRIGYGTTLTDSPVLDNKFERNISELTRLDIPYSIYLFGYAQNEDAATLEANFVMDIMKKYNISSDTFIWYDAELSEFEGVKYTKTMYKKVINKFISVLKENGYNNSGVYGNLYMLTSGGLSSLQKKIPKWVAQYYTRCEYDNDYIGWQYTSNGSIPGVNTRVDMNIFY